MNAYKTHLTFRLKHSGVASVVLLSIFALCSICLPPSSKVLLRQVTFEQYYGYIKPSLFVIFLIFMIMVNLFILYHNYMNGKVRWLLLPQSKATIVIVDGLWLCSIMLMMLLVQWIVYYFGFHSYLNAIEHEHVLNYAQTKDIFVSISKVPILQFLFPGTFIGYMRVLSSIWFLANLVCMAVVQLLMEKSTKWQVWIGCILMIGFIGMLMSLNNDLLQCAVCIICGTILAKLSINSWKKMRVGG